MKFISGSSHPELAKTVANWLKTSLVDCSLSRFSNGEILIEIKESVRGEDVYILQTGCPTVNSSINDMLMELFLLVDACRRSSPKSINVVVPLYPYARQDKKDSPRVPISAKLIANQLSIAGVNRVITLDLHASQIQGFFDIACDNLYAIGLLSKYIEDKLFKDMSLEERQKRFIFASPDNGGVKRIMAYSDRFRIGSVVMHKQRDYQKANQVERCILIGDSVDDKTVILIDDMIDTMGTMIKGIENLIEHGAKDVVVLATHGILSGPAISRIKSCKYIEQVIVTNSIPQEENVKNCGKLRVVDISRLLADVIICLQKGGSISNIFMET